MATTTSQIPTSPLVDTQTSGTDLEEINTEDEIARLIPVNGQKKKRRNYNI